MGLFNRKKSNKETDVKAVKKDSVKSSPEVKKISTEDDIKPKAVKKEIATKIKSSGQGRQTAYRILIRPVISEKATIGVSLNKYVFEVSPDANKVEIKKAIKEIYGISPLAVNILNRSGKNVRFGRYFGRTKNVKKAVVTLKKGDSIKLYEGI